MKGLLIAKVAERATGYNYGSRLTGRCVIRVSVTRLQTEQQSFTTVDIFKTHKSKFSVRLFMQKY